MRPPSSSCPPRLSCSSCCSAPPRSTRRSTFSRRCRGSNRGSTHFNHNHDESFCNKSFAVAIPTGKHALPTDKHSFSDPAPICRIRHLDTLPPRHTHNLRTHPHTLTRSPRPTCRRPPLRRRVRPHSRCSPRCCARSLVSAATTRARRPPPRRRHAPENAPLTALSDILPKIHDFPNR
jgi:hypothetical protein